MKELGLQELLRYALSGGIGIAVLLLTYPKAACSVGHMEGAKEATLILGSILLVGTLIYNFHRALLFPVLLRFIGLWILDWKYSWRLFILPWQPSDAELDVDHWRWRVDEKARRCWDEWGAQTHFLYCAAWTILVALILGDYVWGPPNSRAWHIFWYLFGLALIAGMVNNYRLLYTLNAEMSKKPARFLTLY